MNWSEIIDQLLAKRNPDNQKTIDSAIVVANGLKDEKAAEPDGFIASDSQVVFYWENEFEQETISIMNDTLEYRIVGPESIRFLRFQVLAKQNE